MVKSVGIEITFLKDKTIPNHIIVNGRQFTIILSIFHLLQSLSSVCWLGLKPLILLSFIPISDIIFVRILIEQDHFPCRFLENFTDKGVKSMYKPIDKLQHSFLDFNQPMGIHMNPDNRWIKMADQIPWDEFETKYARLFSSDTGNVAKPLRMALDALII